MQLVINTFGTFLGKTGDCFELKVGEQKRLVSAKKVRTILITTGASLSTDAIELAIQNNVDVVFLDKTGHPFARIWQSKLGSTTKIRRLQLEASEAELGFQLVLEWVSTKVQHQIDFLQELGRHRPGKSEELERYLGSLRAALAELHQLSGSIEQRRSAVMGIEGGAGRAYFAALSFLIPEPFKFQGRSRQPAKDEFNAMLNYAYGILYSMVERACLLAGLDPFVGFLHADNYNKKSLVFDLIEPFRIIAEETTFYLFSKRQVRREHFDYLHNGVSLNSEGKKLLISAFNSRLEERVRYRG
ncbi:MAG: CRISPR-associated endonuclease Cas1, partial [candidate division KSB1 bacterium]|nr:CRISPR-associated endonuclease Cas1 [candidate division KSB1 bacterium]